MTETLSRPWYRFYDSGVPEAFTVQPRTIPQLLEQSAIEFPDATAVIFLNRKITYRQLCDEVSRFATGLARLGVQKDSRVAIQLPNLPQTVIAYYATLSLGAQVVMTNPQYTSRELEHQWTDAGCRVAVVADFVYAGQIAPARDRLPIEHYVIASVPEYLRFPLNLLAPLKLR